MDRHIAERGLLAGLNGTRGNQMTHRMLLWSKPLRVRV
jgi:hypothetical protein